MVAVSLKKIFFKQKTAYEMTDCDWSSDVCSSDLVGNFISKRKLCYCKKLWFFKLNKEISLTTQDSQGVYVFEVLMAFFQLLIFSGMSL